MFNAGVVHPYKRISSEGEPSNHAISPSLDKHRHRELIGDAIHRTTYHDHVCLPYLPSPTLSKDSSLDTKTSAS